MPKTITNLQSHNHPYHSAQATLFDPLWLRDPQEQSGSLERKSKPPSQAQQLRLYVGPELVQAA